MKVTGLNGCEIEISNLKEAITIAKRNTGYSHEDKSFSDFDKRQKAYWKKHWKSRICISMQHWHKWVVH